MPGADAEVGGKVFTVKRETLCVCRGSFLAELFSGRQDVARCGQHCKVSLMMLTVT